MSFADLIRADKKIDSSLDELHTSLAKVKMLAIAQKEELDKQDKLVDTLNNESDKISVEMVYTDRRVNQIINKESSSKSCCYISLVVILLFILMVILYIALS